MEWLIPERYLMSLRAFSARSINAITHIVLTVESCRPSSMRRRLWHQRAKRGCSKALSPQEIHNH
jgi:hypothetical protein